MAEREVDGLKIHYVDTGPAHPDGPPVVFLHGEPTWSFLWRKVIPPVRDAGFRCIAPDLPGFGRSDKPTDIGWYSYDGITEVLIGLFEQLDLKGATLVVHDWGGSLGMRIYVERPEWFDRIVLMDTGLFTGRQRMTDQWKAFRDFVERTEDLPIAMLVRGATARGLDDETAAQYDAPFPDPASKAGARAFPTLIPFDPDVPAAVTGRRVLEAMRADERPVLMLWADSDPILTLDTGRRFAEAIGHDPDEIVVIENASHFLQEDAGEEIGERIAAWLTADTPTPTV